MNNPTFLFLTTRRTCLYALPLLLLSACGGDDKPETPAPIANEIIVENAEANNQLNDTGITVSVQTAGTVNTSCIGNDTEVQDCTVGRDAQANILNKKGSGTAGFDFTKLNADGVALAKDAIDWSCVKDNQTGLIWEVKKDSELHTKQDVYNWYASDVNNTGPYGLENNEEAQCFGYDANQSDSYCNTQAYVARVNAAKLCGAENWRLPKRDELINLVDYGQVNAPAIDITYFPNTQNQAYWSDSLSVRTTHHIWSVNFTQGQVSDTPDLIIESILDPQIKKPVRLVRG